MRTWDYEHRTISLHFHQSNRLVERPNLTNIACHQLISYTIARFETNVNVKPQPKPSTTKTANETETQNHLSTLKPGDTIRIRANNEKHWEKKGSVIAPNDRPHSCNVLNERVT